MDVFFDIFDQAERPTLQLCNPDSTPSFALGTAKNIQVKLKFNALSELTFDIPAQTTSGDITTVVSYYDDIKTKKLVFIQDIGYFVIMSVDEDIKGMVNVKTVTCNSVEAELIFKKVTVLSGTFQFWNPITPSGTLLDTISNLIPTWNIGYIDPALFPVYRTFTVTDKTVYDFLMNDVATAYQCVFKFDITNRIISAYSTVNATISTSIYLSFDNLLKAGKFSELTDELVTTLLVYGAGDLSIAAVNPLGSNTIYNFDYFKNTDWMTQDLIDKINLWEAAIATQQPTYANTLTLLGDAYDELLVLQGELADINVQIKSLNAIKKDRIQQGIGYHDINVQLAALRNQRNSKQGEIDSQNALIATYQSTLVSINNLLAFGNYFNPTEQNILSNYIIQSTYQNSNFVVTDTMTNSEIQDQSQQLYNQAQQVLAKVAQPRYEVSIDSTNFIFLKQFKPFTDQLELGCTATVEKGDGVIFTLVVLEIDFQYDDPTKFTLVLSNRVRLDKNGGFIYSDLFNQSVSAGTSVNFNTPLWSNWNDNYKDTVTEFIDSALNTAKNNLISSDNQEITIDENGLVGRNYDPNTQTYSGDQVWLVNNMLAFSKDGFDTASLALGRITIGTTSTFGLVADVLVGRILAGNELTITNANNTFTVDGTGATLVNASFTLVGNSGNNQIILNPTVGIKVQALVNSQFVDKFYVDAAGNVTFAGVLVAASGSFSGAVTATSGSIGSLSIGTIPTIGGTGLYVTSNPSAYYIKSNGDLVWGALSIKGAVASFSGTINATAINGQINGGTQIIDGTVTSAKISSLSADKISAGTISGVTISGATINWPGVSMYGGGAGISILNVTKTINLTAGLANIAISNNTGGYINIGASNVYFTETNGTVKLPTYIKTSDGSTAINRFVNLSTANTLTFTSGLLTAAT